MVFTMCMYPFIILFMTNESICPQMKIITYENGYVANNIFIQLIYLVIKLSLSSVDLRLKVVLFLKKQYEQNCSEAIIGYVHHRTGHLMAIFIQF